MIGRTLGHFRIIAKIGEGGMGEVYEALDTELDRKVAIKVLPEGLAGKAESLERFGREAKAVAALDHPNIVTIYSIEESEDQRFLVMELVDGDDMARRIASGPLSASAALEIAIPIASALAAAHERGIVHRDLKPANVIVTRSGRVKLLDFGLAKLATETGFASIAASSSAETRDAPLTRVGVLVGTAPYLAPEQLQGGAVDHRADVFALGILLYEMLAGRRPFVGETSALLFASILKDTPPALSVSRVGVPDRLAAIVSRCLEKDPERRFQNATDVQQELESFRDAETAVRRGPPRRATAFGLAIGAALLAIAAAGYLYLHQSSLRSASDVASAAATDRADRTMIVVLPFENLGATEDEYFTAGVTEEITSRLAGVKGLGVISRTSALHYKDSRPSVRQIGEELGVDYLLEGTVRWQRSADGTSRVRVTPQLIAVSRDLRMWTERYDAVLADIFAVQSDIASQVIERLDVALADSQRQAMALPLTDNLEAYDSYLRANEYLHRGRELNAMDSVEFAIDMYEVAVSLEPSFAMAYAKESLAHSWLYFWYHDRTDARLQAAQAAVDRALAIDGELPEAHHASGVIRLASEDLEGAAAEFRLVLDEQPNNADVFYWMSHTLSELGQREEAAASAARSAELNPRMASLACWAGGCAQAMRDYASAIRLHDHAIKLAPDRTCHYACEVEAYINWDGNTKRARRFMETIPPSVPRDGNPSLNWWLIQVDLIDRQYEAALDRLADTPEPVLESPWHYVPKPLLAAFANRMQGETDLARADFEEAVTILEAASSERPNDGRIRSSLGVAYAGLGRSDDAVREGELAVELLGGAKGDPWSYRLAQLAEIYMMLGMQERALDLLDELLSQPAFLSAPRLRADPTWDALREHPRFRALVAD